SRSSRLAGDGVLLARVVGTQQRDALVEPVLDTMTEARARFGDRVTGGGPGAQEAVHGDLAEDDDGAQVAEQTQLLDQVGPAVDDLFRQRLVGGRRAATDRRHERVAQLEAVAAADRSRLVRKAGGVQRLEEEIAAAVAGEQPAGAVAAVRGRSEADDPQASAAVAEPGQRAAPIFLVLIRAALVARHLFAVRDQPRTAATRNDRTLEPIPHGRRRRHICFHTLAKLSPWTERSHSLNQPNGVTWVTNQFSPSRSARVFSNRCAAAGSALSPPRWVKECSTTVRRPRLFANHLRCLSAWRKTDASRSASVSPRST